jgi:hypothetical protein
MAGDIGLARAKHRPETDVPHDDIMSLSRYSGTTSFGGAGFPNKRLWSPAQRDGRHNVFAFSARRIEIRCAEYLTVGLLIGAYPSEALRDQARGSLLSFRTPSFALQCGCRDDASRQSRAWQGFHTPLGPKEQQP